MENQGWSRCCVTVSLKTERYIGHDDWAGDITKPCCEIRVSATINGRDTGGLGNIEKIDRPPAVARIGQLGLVQESADRVYAALAEIENSEYVQAWRERERMAQVVAEDYEAHRARMREMMDDDEAF